MFGFIKVKAIKAGFSVVPAKQCGAIISIGYMSWPLAVHGEESGVYKATKVGIFKPASLCRDYRIFFPALMTSITALV